MKKIIAYITAVVSLVCCFLFFQGFAVTEPSVSGQNDDFYIRYTIDEKLDSVTQMDATNELLFLESNRFYIYAYDFSGTFRFSIHFPYHQNGVTQIRVVNNLLYVKTVDQHIYIFDKDQLVNSFSADDPEYTSLKNDINWYESNVIREGLNKYVVKLGADTKEIIMPKEFRDGKIEQIVFLVGFIALALFLSVYFWKKRPSKNKADRLQC